MVNNDIVGERTNMTVSEIVERHEGGSVGIVERHKRDMNWQQRTPVGSPAGERM